MDELIAFLRARLAEDEKAAHAWLPFGNPDAADREHIARHDPARVLADVAAKRAIVRACAHNLEFEEYGYTLAERTLRALAQPYSEHEDYKPHWSQTE